MFPFARYKQDLYLSIFFKINAWFSVFTVLLILVFILKESVAALYAYDLSLFFNETWYPLEGKFNMLPMLIGSLLAALGAIILALPFGLFTAIFAKFYCPLPLRTSYIRLIELYTGIPSVVFGLWGLVKLVPIINEFHPPGQSLIAGILILALMIFPIIALGLISSFEMASQKYYRVSVSLCLSKSSYIWFILIPSVRGQILGATLLSVGRAVGETMAVLMVCGNIVKIPSSLFDPVRTLTANIALEISYAMGAHRSALFLSGLLLLCSIGCLFFATDALKRYPLWRN